MPHQKTSRLDPYRHLFGVEREAEIARIAGTSRQMVMLYRKANDLPLHPNHRAHPRKPRIVLPEECVALLGKVPDRDLARRYDLDPGTIAKSRRRMGVARFNRRKITDFARANLFTMCAKKLAEHEGVFWTTIYRWRELVKAGKL